jgi:hypothetical protein
MKRILVSLCIFGSAMGNIDLLRKDLDLKKADLKRIKIEYLIAKKNVEIESLKTEGLQPKRWQPLKNALWALSGAVLVIVIKKI